MTAPVEPPSWWKFVATEANEQWLQEVSRHVTAGTSPAPESRNSIVLALQNASASSPKTNRGRPPKKQRDFWIACYAVLIEVKEPAPKKVSGTTRDDVENAGIKIQTDGQVAKIVSRLRGPATDFLDACVRERWTGSVKPAALYAALLKFVTCQLVRSANNR
jgi:hypothetical protein